MAKLWPSNAPADGDDYTYSPMKNKESLLASSRATGATRRLETDEDRNLYVAIAAGLAGLPKFDSTVNVFSSALVAFNTVTTILSYLVPAGQTLYITGIDGWGDTDGEFLVKVDGVEEGGGRTTAATPNVQRDYKTAPIIATEGQTVTITACHFNPSAKTMKGNLLGGIVNG